ncbi:MAG TPA: hypothetical protein VGF38_09085 [Ktedonobacterales bacterium]|jgi:hypothetical protein
MSKAQLKLTRVILSLALALIIVTVAVLSSVPSAQAASFCQCTTYVANHYGLTSNYPDARLWGNGYLQSQSPSWTAESDGYIRSGDIVVFQPFQQIQVTKTLGCCYFNWWASNTSSGHVAIVISLTLHRTVPPYWTVRLQGANQGLTPEWTDSNCTNVSNVYWDIDGNYSGHWMFYHR